MLWREPNYMQGKCAVCRNRPRDFLHPEYPSMCAQCRASRTKPLRTMGGFEKPIDRRSTAPMIKQHKVGGDYVYEKDIKKAQTKCVHGFNIDHCGKVASDVQNLNTQLDPRIQAILNKRR